MAGKLNKNAINRGLLDIIYHVIISRSIFVNVVYKCSVIPTDFHYYKGFSFFSFLHIGLYFQMSIYSMQKNKQTVLYAYSCHPQSGTHRDPFL